MEPATGKLSGDETGPELTPFASQRENHEGTAADSETIPGSIPIRAPLSEDVDDDKEDFGTEESESASESEEEAGEDFQMTTAPFVVESPVGSFTAGNSTFSYEGQGGVRRTNENSSFPVDETEGLEAADERRISAEDEAVVEDFLPLVAMVREVSSPLSHSSSSGLSLNRPVAKLSGDDDEQPREDLGNEDLASEEEGESYNVAKVPHFVFSGGLRVSGEFGDVGVLEDRGMDNGGLRIVEGRVETVENMEGYGEAMTETLCPELVLAKFGDGVEEIGRKASEEDVLGQTVEVQNLVSAVQGAAFAESELKEPVGGDGGFQVEEEKFFTNEKESALKNSGSESRESSSAEIEAKVLADVGEGVLKDSNDKQLEAVSAEIETKVLTDAQESVSKDFDDKQLEIANAGTENEILATDAADVLKDSDDRQQEVASAGIGTEVYADAEEGALKDSNDKKQDIANAEIGNKDLAYDTGVFLEGYIDEQQAVTRAKIETEALPDAEEGVSKDSNDKQQKVASPEIATEVLADAKEGILKDPKDRQQEIDNETNESEVLANAAGGLLKDPNNKGQEIANAEIELDALVNSIEGVLKDSNDKQREIANEEIESEALANAKEGFLKDSNDKQEEVATAEIVDTGKVVDGDTLVAVNSEQDGITIQGLLGSQKEANDQGICNEDSVGTNMATDVTALLDNDLVDGVVEQEVIKNEKEVDDLGKSVADDIKEAKAVPSQGIAKEIPLHESESMHEHVADSKQEGPHKDGPQLEREGMDGEDIVNTVKHQGDGALLDFDSKQDWVTEEDVLDCRKEGLDGKQIEADDLLETKVAHLQATAKEWILEDPNVKQEGTDKGLDSQESRTNETQQTNVAEMHAGMEVASDNLESKKNVMSVEEPDNTQKTEADDKQETKAAESETIKGLDVSNETTREGAKFNLESQTCQGLGQLKEGVELAQGEKLGSLEPKKCMESEVLVTNANVSEKAQDGIISQPEASTVDLFTQREVNWNPETKSNFSVSRDEHMEDKYAVEEENVATGTKPQFKFESSTSNNQSIQNVVGRMVADWGGEADDDDDEDEDEDEDEELIDSPAWAALLEAATSAGTVSNNPSVGASGFSVSTPPAGLGSSVPLLDPIPRYLQHSRTNEPAFSRSSALVEDNQDNTDSADAYDETQEKLQTIRVKFLRLVKRLDQSTQNVVVTQVLYRLGLAEGLKRGRSIDRAVSFDRGNKIAEELEAAGNEDLDFTCNILVLGKTGVGKSATINSIFDEVRSATSAFRPATKKVQEILGTIHGIKVRVVDTPGLMSSFSDQHRNKAILSSVKKFIRKCPPDIVLYVDRLDVQSRDYSDLPLLKIITETFGAAIWFNAIVVLTHASSAPPDGPSGTPLSYEMFMGQRSQIVQHSIRQAAGDMRLMNPVSLVENHPLCRKNTAGQSVLPNGQVWKPQLLLLCFSSKVLAEANALLKLQDSTPGRPFGFRTRAPPLPFLLSSLLQSRAQLKVPDEQTGEDIDSDEDLEQLSDSDGEDEYDRLPPFKPLSKYQLSKLTKEQRKAYFDEVDYREKLFQKKQWKEELKRRRNIKKTHGTHKVESDTVDENFEEDITGAAAVAVPMPDMAMPLAFDSDNPTYRYRYLETADQWLVRPVLDTHGWDHDIGYDGVNVEKMIVIGNKVPASISGQITKDKKEANLQLECAASLKHGEHKVTQAGFDVQTVGKGLAYTLRGETRFSNFKCNKTTGGLALTYLGDTFVTGMKLEDRIMIGKRLKFAVNGGAMTGGGHVAYGGSLEATLRDKDYPIGQTLSTLGISIMNWHGDFAIGGNLQSQFGIGRKMMIVTRANLNNKGSGQISVRTSSSEQLQLALIGIIPVIRALIGGRLFGSDSTQ